MTLNKMKNDRLIYAVVIVGIIIAYVSFFYAVDCYSKYNASINDMKRISSGQTQKAIYFEYYGENDWISEMFGEADTCFYLTGVNLYYDKARTSILTRVYLGFPCECPFQFIKGEMPDLTQREHVAVLGKNRKQLTYGRNGEDYIRICGEEYRVTGYISEENSGIADNLILLYWNNCGESVKNVVDFYACTPVGACAVAESGDVEQWYYGHLDLLNANASHIRISDNYMDDYTIEMNDIYMKFIYLLYGFSIIVLVIVMKYWISMHTDEFLIRRMIGYERQQLLIYVGKKIIMVLLCVVTPCLLTQMVMNYISGSLVKIVEQLKLVVGAVAFCAVTLLILLLYPLYRILIKDIAGERRNF